MSATQSVGLQREGDPTQDISIDSNVALQKSPEVEEASQLVIYSDVITPPVSVNAVTESEALTSMHDSKYCAEPSDLSFIFTIVPLILVVVGWRVIYSNSKKLSTRSETKSIVDDVISIVADLEKLVVEYWLSGRQQRMDSNRYLLEVNAKLQMLVCRLNIANDRNLKVDRSEIGNLSTLMTLNCEDVDRQQESDKREQVQLFLESSNEFVQKVYDNFHELYKPTSPNLLNSFFKNR